MPRGTTREDMLRSAALLFRERGVEATSLVDIVDHAGAPRGSIYHHFPRGKEQLVEEATRAAGALLGAMISAGLAEVGPAATVRSILAEFRQHLVESNFTAGCPVAPAALDGVGSPGARAAAGESFESWEDTIAASLWQRGVGRERSRGLATLSVASIEGALLIAKAQRTTQALDRVEVEILDLLRTVLSDSDGTGS